MHAWEVLARDARKTYAGKTVMARDHAMKCKELTPWRNYDLTVSIAVAYGESKLSLGAYHDNPNGTRDCGIYEININADQIGTATETRLRSESKDPLEYVPVWEYSIKTAYSYWQDRKWQPWYAYPWAVFPYAWVWHHDVDGNGVGPWVPTGRYLFKAIAGQMNNLVVNERTWSSDRALFYTKSYADHFKINDGSEPYLYDDYYGNTIVGWHYGPAPTDPPADGHGPYPGITWKP